LSLPGSKFVPVRKTLFIGSREATDYYFSVQTSPIERLDMYLCSNVANVRMKVQERDEDYRKHAFFHSPVHRGISQVKKYVGVRRLNFQKTSFLDMDINASPIFQLVNSVHSNNSQPLL
jgi:hypothetical protein